jgi:hypothetical protein
MKQEAIQLCESTSKERMAIEVTIYNNDLAMVTDRRKIKLPKGLTELKFVDVPAALESDSVHIHSVTAPDDLLVLEQNCEHERIGPGHVFSRYVGKEVELYRRNHHTDQRELTKAIIVYSGKDGVLYKIGDEIIMTPPEEIVFQNASTHLVTQSAIIWLLRNEKPSPQTIEAAYLTKGVSWRAHYNIVANRDDTRADILGWATVQNRCGMDFVNASLTLVAGDTNRLSNNERNAGICDYSHSGDSVPFKEESFADYHIYHLARQVILKDGQTKQIELLKARNVKIKKEYRLSGPALHNIPDGLDLSGLDEVNSYLVIENKKKHGIGMPLPKGNVHVYKHDSEGRLQFVGEDKISHVPENETTSIKIGTAFDITAGRIQTEVKEIATDVHETAFKIFVRNHKKEDVNIRILEQISSRWEIVESPDTYRRLNAGWVEWPTKVKRNREAILSYRIRIPT